MQGAGERLEPVSNRGGLLEALGVRESPHPRPERFEEPVRGLEGGEEVPDELSVALGVDPTVAGGRAAPDVGERAGGETGARPHRPRTATEGDDLFERLLGEAAPPRYPRTAPDRCSRRPGRHDAPP